MKKSLVFYPTKSLRQPSERIADFDEKKLTELISDMTDTMNANNGVGLAAPQIGLNIRLVVIHTKDGILPMINPEITHFSLRKTTGEEGCLSIPGVFGEVKRAQKISVRSYTPKGEKKEFTATGLFARVIQHEIDHLDGVLFIDRTKIITTGADLLKDYEKRQA